MIYHQASPRLSMPMTSTRSGWSWRKNTRHSDAQTEITRASAKWLDIAVTGGGVSSDRGEDSGLDEAIKSQQAA